MRLKVVFADCSTIQWSNDTKYCHVLVLGPLSGITRYENIFFKQTYHIHFGLLQHPWVIKWLKTFGAFSKLGHRSTKFGFDTSKPCWVMTLLAVWWLCRHFWTVMDEYLCLCLGISRIQLHTITCLRQTHQQLLGKSVFTDCGTTHWSNDSHIQSSICTSSGKCPESMYQVWCQYILHFWEMSSLPVWSSLHRRFGLVVINAFEFQKCIWYLLWGLVSTSSFLWILWRFDNICGLWSFFFLLILKIVKWWKINGCVELALILEIQR